MPTKTKDTAPDASIALLTEMRDLQKEQNALMKQGMEIILHTAKMQRRDKIIKIVFYAAIIAFSIISTYMFYATIAGGLGGLIPTIN